MHIWLYVCTSSAVCEAFIDFSHQLRSSIGCPPKKNISNVSSTSPLSTEGPRMTVSNCCCCADLRRGVVLIAAGEIILTLFAMIMMLVYM